MKVGFFLIRASRNVRLLYDLGRSIERIGHIDYLWLDTKRRTGDQPLRLRLIKVTGEKGKSMSLLTNVYDRGRLSDEQPAAIDHRRWGIEVCYRTLKDTMDRHAGKAGWTPPDWTADRTGIVWRPRELP